MNQRLGPWYARVAVAFATFWFALNAHAQLVMPLGARVQLPALTEGPIARQSLNSVLQTLPPGLPKNKLAAELNRLATSAQGSSPVEFEQAANRSKSAIVEARSELGTAGHREVLDAVALTLRATEKAYYSKELRRNYPPDSYKTIFERSEHAIALVQKSTGSPYCSGALVSATLVLTAKHCTKDIDLADVEVWKHYVQHEDGSTSAPRKIAVKGLQYEPTDVLLDFALIAVSGEAGPVQDPPCLSTDRVRLRELLYILGHPQQRPLTVHDFAEVLFPYEVAYSELDQIILDQRIANATDEVIASIKSSYVQSPAGTYTNSSAVWGNQPTIGILADTFRGNSGAPVFSRNTHRLVGVFVRGQPDYADPWTASWLRHEAVLPAARIIGDLQQNTTLISDGNLCVR
jgi:Trypsin